MTEKAEIPINLLDNLETSPVIEAWFEIVHLKQLFREGWLQRGVESGRCESVADHTFGNAMLCLLLAPAHPELDLLKVLKMALVHDLGEAYVGDITPMDDVPAEQKKRDEAIAVQKILGKLPDGGALIDTWHEYETQETPEARFVKQIDRLEFAMQAGVYHRQGLLNASEFMLRVQEQLVSPSLRATLDALMRLPGLTTTADQAAV